MKTNKKSRNQSLRLLEDRSKKWKEKAMRRGRKCTALKKRVKELESSRDGWKSKYMEAGQLGAKNPRSGSGKAAGHQYSLSLVTLVLSLYQYGGMSLRSCGHCIACLQTSLHLSLRSPSHSSIRNWVCKSGLYRMHEAGGESGCYVVYLDESITFGSEKILLILGIDLQKIPADGALTHQDMSVLYVGASSQWKAEDIEPQLKAISSHKQISYVVSDKGTNLRKAYKLHNINHIEDCTHLLANHIKALYQKYPDFEAFGKLIGKLRRDWNLSKDKCQYMPPGMRSKMRFANIFVCVDWAEKILVQWDKLDQEVQHKLAWLNQKKAFINSLIEVGKIFKLICARLKKYGFSPQQQQVIIKQLDQLNISEQMARSFRQKCEQYLDGLEAKRKLVGVEKLLCCSDIIESFFGKYKAKTKANHAKKLSEFIFTLATFGKKFTEQETKNALEKYRCKDLKTHMKLARAA